MVSLKFASTYYLHYTKTTVCTHWSLSQYKDCLSQAWDCHVKDKTRDRLILNMEIPILVRRHLYIETPPLVSCQKVGLVLHRFMPISQYCYRPMCLLYRNVATVAFGILFVPRKCISAADKTLGAMGLLWDFKIYLPVNTEAPPSFLPPTAR